MKKGCNGLILLALLGSLAGCQKKNDLSKVPQISDLLLVPDSIRVKPPSEDTAYIQFTFTDGDADLAPPGGAIYVRNILDSSGAKPEQFSIADRLDQYLDPSLGLRGSSIIVLPSSFPFFQLKDTTVLRDTAQFEVYLRDEAGNTSNKLTTPPLILLNR